jgi:stage V sporulation protein B
MMISIMSILPARFQQLGRVEFMRKVATLGVGSFAGNFIQAIIGIFLARLLQPESFGIYTLALSLASLAAVILGAGSQDAVTTLVAKSYAQGDRSSVKDAFAFLFKISIITALIAMVFTLALPYIAASFYENADIGRYASYIVYASIISTLFFSATLIALQVTGKIRTMSILAVSDQTFRYGIALIAVMLGGGVYGAVSGHLWGALVIAVISLAIWSRTANDYSLLPSFKDIIQRAWHVPLKKYFGFSFWIALDRNIANLYLALPLILTGLFVIPTEVTYFKLAFGYINLGLSLLGPISTVLNVEFPKTQVEDKNKLANHFTKVSLYSLGISSILTLGLVVLSPLMFRILYGEAFLPSIQYTVGLFSYGALFGIGVGLGPMWRAVNKVKVSIVINLITLAVGIPLGWLLIREMGLWGSVWMVTAWFTVSHFISFLYLKNYLKKKA